MEELFFMTSSWCVFSLSIFLLWPFSCYCHIMDSSVLPLMSPNSLSQMYLKQRHKCYLLSIWNCLGKKKKTCFSLACDSSFTILCSQRWSPCLLCFLSYKLGHSPHERVYKLQTCTWQSSCCVFLQAAVPRVAEGICKRQGRRFRAWLGSWRHWAGSPCGSPRWLGLDELARM